jgi:hypothetical protein
MAEIGAVQVQRQFADAIITPLIEPARLLPRLYADLP